MRKNLFFGLLMFIGFVLFLVGFGSAVETWSAAGIIPGAVGLALLACAVFIQEHT